MIRFAVSPEVAAKHRAAASRQRRIHRATLRPIWRTILTLAAGFVFLAVLEFLAALEATP